jgi:hypothetical protein
VAGYTWSFGAGNDDMYIVKLGPSGTLEWSKCVGGTGQELAYSIAQTMDGGFVTAGLTTSFGAGDFDMYIVKLNSSGMLEWTRTAGGADWDYANANSIIQTEDSGYVVAGSTESFGAGSWDFYIVKLNSAGMLQWSKTVGGTSSEFVRSITKAGDGGYVVAGETFSFGAGRWDTYIVKLDSSGSLDWSRTVGGTGIDYAKSIAKTTDGGYVIAGETISFGGSDMYIVKLNGSGTVQWTKAVHAVENGGIAYSIIQTTDGGYAATGQTTVGGLSRMCLIKLDASGNTCGNTSSVSSSSGTGGITFSPTSDVYSTNPTIGTPPSTTGTGATVTAICTITGTQHLSNEIPSSFKLFQNYPNPFNPKSKIKYQIAKPGYVKLVVNDALGKQVAILVNGELMPGTYEVEWDGSNYPSGVYFYKLTSENFSETKRMVLIK